MKAEQSNRIGMFAWAVVLIISIFSAGPVLAHHPLEGIPMETFTQGLLSGVGHPLLGFDHLFFIIVAGVLIAYSGYSRRAPLVLIVGVLSGVMLSVSGLSLPAAEILIALSLIILGVIGIRGKSLSLLQAGSLFLTLGVLHGLVFGAVLAQQVNFSAAVLAGYMAGLSVVLYLITLMAGRLLIFQFGALEASDLQPRIASAVVTGVGVTFLFGHLEALILT